MAMGLAERLVDALGVDEVEELVGGHQSRVFRAAERNGRPVVAKVLDASLTDRVELEIRIDAVAALSDLDPRVCPPVEINEQRISELTSADGHEHYVVCYEFAPGTEPDPARAVDATRMGAALSTLHESMSQLPAFALPVVSALDAIKPEKAVGAGARQLLHGDFNASNLRCAGGVVRIFDLDDCGYGPPEFDVANALYQVLFDAVTRGTVKTYETFRPSFVDGYAGASGPSLREESLDRFIDLRVRALASWLDDLDHAPIGIRTASRAWQATLRSFAASYQPSTRSPIRPLG